MNTYLKDTLRFIMSNNSPISIKEICTGLNEQEYFAASAIGNLEALGLLEKAGAEGFVLSRTATEYMSMT